MNVAIGVAPADDVQMKGFFQRLDAINNVARGADGFIAMLSDADSTVASGGTGISSFPEGWYVNLSLWRDIESFQKFVYTGAHANVLRRKHEWFVEWDEETSGYKQVCSIFFSF